MKKQTVASVLKAPKHPARTQVAPKATVSPPSTAVVATPPSVPLTAPPDIVIPAPPDGFVPVNLAPYRGSHPKAGQLAAVPGAVAELNASTSYATTFGPAVPPAAQLSEELTIAARWTALRIAAEFLLGYLKTYEAITWKSALDDLELLDRVFQVFTAQNPTLVSAFPEVAKLLDVPKMIAQKAVSTRARNAKEKARAASTPGSTTPTTPSGTAAGGAAH